MKRGVDVRDGANAAIDVDRGSPASAIVEWFEPVTRVINIALQSRPLYVALCVLAAAFTVGMALYQRSTYASGGDLAYFLQRSREVLAHQDPYASTVAGLHTQGRAYPDIFFYDPFFYLLISPLTLMSFGVAWTIWATMNGFFLVIGIVALTKAMRPNAPLLAGLLLAGGAALTSMARFELYYGNVDVLLLCLLACTFLAARHGRQGLAGVLLALSGLFYIQSLPFVLFYVWKREYRIAALGFAGWLVTFAASFLLIPASSVGNFLTMSGYFVGGWAANFINQSIYAVFMRLFDPIPGVATALVSLPWLPALVWLANACAVCVVAGRVIRRVPVAQGPSARAGLEFVCAVAALSLIFPVLESNTLIIGGLIMSGLLIAAVAYGLRQPFQWVAGAVVIIFALSFLPLIKLMSLGQGTELHGLRLFINTIVSAPYLYIAVALAVLTYIALRNAERAAGGDTTSYR